MYCQVSENWVFFQNIGNKSINVACNMSVFYVFQVAKYNLWLLSHIVYRHSRHNFFMHVYDFIVIYIEKMLNIQKSAEVPIFSG